MKLETIKEAVNKKFNLDISVNTRQRNYSYAKKVFSKLAYESGATFREVGDVIKKSHCNILHHVNSINVITLEDKKKHDQIIRELNLVLSKPFFNSEQDKIKKEIKRKTTNKTIKEIQDVIDILTGWDIETVTEFKQTRLDPFNALIKTRVRPKTIKEVKGALLNNRVRTLYYVSNKIKQICLYINKLNKQDISRFKIMSDKHGGARKGAGRPAKADEVKLIERLDAIIDKDEALGVLGQLVAKGDIRAVQLYLSYRYGKPKESIDLNSSEGLNINFRDLIKFVD